MKDSIYQENIYDEVGYGKSNIAVNAVAGSGKTTTIIKCLDIIPRDATSMFCAFNGDIVKAISKKIGKKRPTSTIHSIGWQAMLRHYRGAEIKIDKVKELVYKLTGKWTPWSYVGTMEKMVDLMRLNLVFDDLAVLELMEKHNVPLVKYKNRNFLEDCLEVVHMCIEDRRHFDFTDMVFIPALNDNLHINKFQYVFIDECQDLNNAQQAVTGKMLDANSRFIAVGDRNQAIYGFAGADHESFEHFANSPNTVSLPLSICYRCGKNIVEKAKLIVPHIEAWDEAEDGLVAAKSWQEVQDGDWVLCRNVRPLVLMCLKLIREGRKAHVRGKDIGKSIIKLIKSTKQDNKKMCYYIFQRYIEDQTLLLLDYGVKEPDKHSSVIELREILALVTYIGEECRDVTEIIEKLESIFTDEVQEGIQMMTMHKSKGLETPRVMIICPELIPSPFAIKEWQRGQERNLQYVAYTRAKSELFISSDFAVTNLISKT